MNIHKHPIITINNQTYHGDFTGSDVARAICASFQIRPSFCEGNQIIELAEKKEFEKLEEMGLVDSYSIRHLMFIGFIIVLANIVIVFLHKRRQKQQGS